MGVDLQDFGMNPEMSVAFQNGNILKLLESNAIKKAVESGDYFSLLSSEEFGGVMNDPEAMKLLMELGMKRMGKSLEKMKEEEEEEREKKEKEKGRK
ncbi:MAG: hypothetical protein Kow0090_21180 [Myxococcota bacterium]